MKTPSITDIVNASITQISSTNFNPKSIHFSFKVNESKLNDLNIDKFRHQLELITKRLSGIV